jgi:fluoroquinolone transport system permease protein
MRAVRAFRALGPVDARSVVRDELLIWMMMVPLLMGAGVRFLVPYAAGLIRQAVGFNLAPYFPLLVSLLAQIMPLMAGMVIGFLLLDQRDDRTLAAIQVTPLGLDGYLVYRLALPLALSVVFTAVMIPLTGLAPLGWLDILLIALSAAPLAPIMALFLALVAENKVQGLALTKALGVIVVPPAAAYFIPGSAQWLFGIVPTFWPARFCWALQAGDPAGAWIFLAGWAYLAAFLAILVIRFRRMSQKSV